MKRDVVGEITGKKARGASRGHRYRAFYARYKLISAALDHLQTLQPDDPARIELLKYIPIGFVAALEGYYRHAIRDLINYGKPYIENAQKLDELRIDLRTVLRMRGARVSLGDFVAHLLPMSSFEDINRHLSVLLGESYFDRLKRTRLGDDKPTLGEANPSVRRDLDALFQDRHIFAHELAPNTTLTAARAASHFHAALSLILADDTLMEELLVARPRRRRSAV